MKAISIENIKSLLIVVFSAIVILLLFQNGCGDGAKNYAEDILNYDNQIKLLRAKNGQLAESNRVLQLQHGQRSKYIDSIKKQLKLKEVDVIIKYKSVFKYDTINHVFRYQLPCDDFVDSFKVDSTHFKFDAVITNKRLSLYNIEVPNQQSIIIGEKKKGWLRSSDYSVVITNSNPNIKGEGLEAYTFKPSPKWYNSYKFKGAIFVAGVIGGFLLVK
ncbi:MAG: hypothetical protein RLZZ196_971 [Bacteroidota bacterium]|jgi:hypothetical protein